jgi:hypothetical protein|uniref:Uncharacterized protein n=1 Tax=Zea mays TaxID=4577 RepID=B6UCB5_MAIZE|nr:hypothetical protein [Zea mays]
MAETLDLVSMHDHRFKMATFVFYANKTITKASHTSLHGHSTILTYESVLS